MRWRAAVLGFLSLWLSLGVIAPASAASQYDPHAFYNGVRIDQYDATINMSKSFNGFVRLDVVENITLQWSPKAKWLYAFPWVGRDSGWPRYALFNNRVDVISGQSSIRWPWSFCARGGCSGSDRAYVTPPPLDSIRRVSIRSSYTIVGDLRQLKSRESDVVEWRNLAFAGERIFVNKIRWNIAPELRSSVMEPGCLKYSIYCAMSRDHATIIQREVTAAYPDMSEDADSWVYMKPGTFTEGNAFWSGNDWFIASIPLGVICLALMAWRYFTRRIREEILPHNHVYQRSGPISEYSPSEVAALLYTSTELGATVLVELAMVGGARFIDIGNGKFDVLFMPGNVAEGSIHREMIDRLIASYPKHPPRYSLDPIKTEVILEGVVRVSDYLDQLNVKRGLTGNMWIRHGFMWGNTALALAAVVCVCLGLGLRESFTSIPVVVAVISMIVSVSRERGSVATAKGISLIKRVADLRAYFTATEFSTRHHKGVKRITSYSEWQELLPWAVALDRSSIWIDQLRNVNSLTSWPDWLKSSKPFSQDALAETIRDILSFALRNSMHLEWRNLKPAWVKFFDETLPTHATHDSSAKR
jgi:hypothetical protein